MRTIAILGLASVLMLGGCGDDDGVPGTGGSAGTGGSDGGGGGSAGQGGTAGTSGSAAPAITRVDWAPVGDCSSGVRTDYTVTVSATDSDSAASELIYSGSVSGCTGQIDAETSTLSCPNVAPYGGMASVQDADGNRSASVEFTIGVCDTGSLTL